MAPILNNLSCDGVFDPDLPNTSLFFPARFDNFVAQLNGTVQVILARQTAEVLQNLWSSGVTVYISLFLSAINLSMTQKGSYK